MTRKEEYQYMKKAFENVSRHKVYTTNNGYTMALFYTQYNFEPYCLDFTKLENYEKAEREHFKGWHCHHRLEKEYTREDLIKAGLYYNRPPEELIFLTNAEHSSLHCKYNSEKGFSPAKGHTYKPSKRIKEETAERFKSLVWVNNGIVNKRVLKNNIPEGFVIGRKKGWESKLKGKKWGINQDGKRYWY